MNIRVDQPILDLDNNPVMENGKVLTIRTVCETALLAVTLGNEQEPAEEKVMKFKLAMRIHGQDTVTMTPEEAVVLKKVVAKLFGALIVGQVFEVLNG